MVKVPSFECLPSGHDQQRTGSRFCTQKIVDRNATTIITSVARHPIAPCRMHRIMDQRKDKKIVAMPPLSPARHPAPTAMRHASNNGSRKEKIKRSVCYLHAKTKDFVTYSGFYCIAASRGHQHFLISISLCTALKQPKYWSKRERNPAKQERERECVFE